MEHGGQLWAGFNPRGVVKGQAKMLGSEPGWSGRRAHLGKNQGRKARRWQFVGRLWVLD